MQNLVVVETEGNRWIVKSPDGNKVRCNSRDEAEIVARRVAIDNGITDIQLMGANGTLEGWIFQSPSQALNPFIARRG